MAKEYRDHNVLSAQGISDVEMLETNGGPAKYAGTPQVNTFMIQKTYRDNIDSGMGRREANIRKIEAQKLVKSVKDRRGY